VCGQGQAGSASRVWRYRTELTWPEIADISAPSYSTHAFNLRLGFILRACTSISSGLLLEFFQNFLDLINEFWSYKEVPKIEIADIDRPCIYYSFRVHF